MGPLKTLQDSVIASLENGEKGSVFPVFHEAVGSVSVHTPGDLEPQKIPLLKKELEQIAKAMAGGMQLVVSTVTVNVPIHETGYSPLFGIPVEKDAAETLFLGFLQFMEQCEMALVLGCGFGKYSASSEDIKKAITQLRERPETVSFPLEGEVIELHVFAFDSNSNPKHRLLVDGMWVPYRAIGIVRSADGSITLGFEAKMDYGSGRWDLERLDTAFLSELAEKSSLFLGAYKTVAKDNFNPVAIKEVNPAIISALKASRFFQQILSRVCSRWMQ